MQVVVRLLPRKEHHLSAQQVHKCLRYRQGATEADIKWLLAIQIAQHARCRQQRWVVTPDFKRSSRILARFNHCLCPRRGVQRDVPPNLFHDSVWLLARHEAAGKLCPRLARGHRLGSGTLKSAADAIQVQCGA